MDEKDNIFLWIERRKMRQRRKRVKSREKTNGNGKMEEKGYDNNDGN